VINSDGSIGNYSAMDGQRTKIRLLAMERRDVNGYSFQAAQPRRARALAKS
jgi:hypothetical protein